MMLRRIVIAITLSALSVVLVPVALAQGSSISMKNVESVCLNVRQCDARNFNGCSSYNTSPLGKVHRAHLTVNSNLSDNKLYIEECFEVPGATDDFCVPYAITEDGNGGWMIKNFLPNGGQELEWTNGGKELVQNTLLEMCIANFMNPTEGTARCGGLMQEFYANDANWALGNAFLSAHRYAFHGIYAGVSAPSQPLTPLTQFPVTGQRGSTFEWGSSTTDLVQRTFRATAFSVPVSGTSGSDPSNKVGQLGFTVGEGTCETSANYDPLGRVFSGSNLEPIENAKVALYREVSPTPPMTVPEYQLVTRSMVLNGYAFQNPQSSGSLGYFSFTVPPGMYKLLVVPDGASVPSTLGNISANSSPMDTNATRFGESINVTVNGTVYGLYPEVYQVTTDGTNVLLPPIEEGESPERRDIAMSGLAPAEPRALSLKRVTNSSGDAVIRGRINKPFGIATLRRRSDSAVVGTANADGDGRYSLVIPANLLPPGGQIVVSAAAVPLVQVTPTSTPEALLQQIWGVIQKFFAHEVQAQSAPGELTLDSRLNYLEGYAYDPSGGLLKNATVTIFDKSRHVPVYTTTTDKEGYYRVSSENLPRNDYLIWYTTEGSDRMISVKPGEFYTQNKEYIEKQSIRLMEPQYSEQAQLYLTQHPEPTTRPGESSLEVRPGMSGTPRSANPPDRAVTDSNPLTQQVSPALLMYVVILLMLIVGAGLLILFYLKRRQEPHLYE